MTTHRDLINRAGETVQRYLRRYEYIQLANLAKKYGRDNVYNAFNHIDAKRGYFYHEIVAYLEAHIKIEDIKVEDVISGKKRTIADRDSMEDN